MAMSESVVKRIPCFDSGGGGEDQGQGDFSPGFLNLSMDFFSPSIICQLSFKPLIWLLGSTSS